MIAQLYFFILLSSIFIFFSLFYPVITVVVPFFYSSTSILVAVLLSLAPRLFNALSSQSHPFRPQCRWAFGFVFEFPIILRRCARSLGPYLQLGFYELGSSRIHSFISFLPHSFAGRVFDRKNAYDAVDFGCWRRPCEFWLSRKPIDVTTLHKK